jgi:hypothetical protein
MTLDIRLPIGLMFSLVGALLLIYGLVTSGDAEIYRCSFGININIWWGIFCLVFGLSMLAWAWLTSKADRDQP